MRWCLLNSDLDVDDVARIPYRQALSAANFVYALRRCSDAGLSRLEFPLYVTTGRGQGHTIHIQAFDNNDVVYHDPWPGRSLLAAGNNRMNVGARPEPERRLWRTTTEELARVGYASLVEPAVWLPICGVQAELPFADITASDLVGFFHFHETGRVYDEEEEVTHIAMTPGNWQENISLVVTIDTDENVRTAQLLVDRTWIEDRASAPFAADLLKSYVRAVVTEGDIEAVRAAASRIHSFQSRSELRNGIDGLRATLVRRGSGTKPRAGVGQRPGDHAGLARKSTDTSTVGPRRGST